MLTDVETTIIPQGVLAEKIRAGGAEVKAIVLELCGKEYYEKSIKADVALIKADSIDSYNNLVYRGTDRNFNPIMATAANKTIVEVDSFYRGAFNVEHIITSGLYVDLVYEESRYKK